MIGKKITSLLSSYFWERKSIPILYSGIRNSPARPSNWFQSALARSPSASHAVVCRFLLRHLPAPIAEMVGFCPTNSAPTWDFGRFLYFFHHESVSSWFLKFISRFFFYSFLSINASDLGWWWIVRFVWLKFSISSSISWSFRVTGIDKRWPL